MSLKSHNSIKQMSYLKKIAKEEKYKGIIFYGIMLIKTEPQNTQTLVKA